MSEDPESEDEHDDDLVIEDCSDYWFTNTKALLKEKARRRRLDKKQFKKYASKRPTSDINMEYEKEWVRPEHARQPN